MFSARLISKTRELIEQKRVQKEEWIAWVEIEEDGVV